MEKIKNKVVFLAIFLIFVCKCSNGNEKGKIQPEEKVFEEKDCCQAHLQCQDGLWCTGIERCNCWGVCISGTPPDCNDGDPATVDTCVNDYIGRPGVRGDPGVDGEIGTGHCEHKLVGIPCTVDADCDDGDVCTADKCVANFCSYSTVNCDDGDICTADSCDSVMGCVHNAMQNCCTVDSHCSDGYECTLDRCNTTTHLCSHTARTGASCTFSNECFNPGVCGSDGLCHPGSQRIPPNDTCAGAVAISLSNIGEACVEGSTMCARHDYTGSCAYGMNPDVTYSFQYSTWLGSEINKNGVPYNAHQHGNCEIIDGTAVGCCTNNWWEYVFNFPSSGNYRTGIETSNYPMDLTSPGIKHRVSVYLDGIFKGEIVNPATSPQTSKGSIFLGWVTAGNHTIRYYWTNDWYVPPNDSNIKIHRVWIQSDNTPYQLYSYNVLVDGEFDTVLYARRSCEDPSTQLFCNNNCVTTGLLDCNFYGLDVTDSGITLPPYPAGELGRVWLIVDGVGGERGDFRLQIFRIQHKNNPCATVRDNIRLVDATKGGEFRGNINGYLNDLFDSSSSTWIKTSCHSSSGTGSDWPARAWFVIAPSQNTNYRIWTDELTPANWFDSVIEVWEVNTLLRCGGSKTLKGCAHINGQNGPASATTYSLNAEGGKVYIVGVSPYDRPVAGNYIVHFDIL